MGPKLPLEELHVAFKGILILEYEGHGKTVSHSTLEIRSVSSARLLTCSRTLWRFHKHMHAYVCYLLLPRL